MTDLASPTTCKNGMPPFTIEQRQRLLESAHISGYTFERVCSELEWLLDDNRWRHVGAGYTDINVFLATVDLSPFNITAEKRKGLVRRLDQLKATQRATAKAIGVGQSTVDRDLKSPTSDPDGSDDLGTVPDEQRQQEQPDPDGSEPPDAPPGWFARNPADVARDAATGTRQAAARTRTPTPVGEPVSGADEFPPAPEVRHGVTDFGLRVVGFGAPAGAGPGRAADGRGGTGGGGEVHAPAARPADRGLVPFRSPRLVRTLA